MKASAICAVLLLLSTLQAQQNAQSQQQQAAIMKRGDEGMGFSHDKTMHHFVLLKDGGLIQVSTNDAKDDASGDHIRMHVSHIGEMFSAATSMFPFSFTTRRPPACQR